MREGEPVRIHTADGTEFAAVIHRVTCITAGQVTGIEVRATEEPGADE